MYTYKHIILYIFKSSLILTSLFTDTLLCLSSAHLLMVLKTGPDRPVQPVGP
jgi:hypothetical protein